MIVALALAWRVEMVKMPVSSVCVPAQWDRISAHGYLLAGLNVFRVTQIWIPFCRVEGVSRNQIWILLTGLKVFRITQDGYP